MIQEQSVDDLGRQDTGPSVPVELFGGTFPHKEMFKDVYGLRFDGTSKSWSGKVTQDQADALDQFCKEHKVGHRIGTGPRHSYERAARAVTRSTNGGAVMGEGKLDVADISMRHRKPGRRAPKFRRGCRG